MDIKMLQNTAFLRVILDALQDGVYVVDSAKKILLWNQGAERITGFSEEEVAGRYCDDNILRHVNIQGEKLCVSGGCPLGKTLEDGKEREQDLFLQHKKGHRVPVHVRIKPLATPQGKILGAAETFTDTSSQASTLEKLNLYRDLALKDQVTGVGNRRYGEIYLRSRLAAFEEDQWPFGICKVGINDIDTINSKYGHSMGDELLKVVATTISKTMGDGDFISRWGGGEFLLVLPSCRSKKDILSSGDRLRLLAQRSTLWIEGRLVFPSTSLGGTVAQKGDSSEDILKRASQALLLSKKDKEHRTVAQ